MEFDKSRIYTAVNADELQVGSKCIFADTVQDLRKKVQGGYSAGDCAEDYFSCLAEKYEDDRVERFVSDCDDAYLYAYLIEPPTEKKYKPFESGEEAMKAIKEHGGWIKILGSYWLVTGYDMGEDTNKPVQIANNWISLDRLFQDYVFDDDSPCGVSVEE